MTTTHPRSRGKTALVAGAGGVTATALVALLIVVNGQMTAGSHEPEQPVGASDAIPIADVRDALGDDCRQFLTQGPAKGPRTVIVLDRTGLLAGAQVPGRELEQLARTAQNDDADKLGSVSVVTVGGTAEDTHVVADNAALMDSSAGTARQGRIAEDLPECLGKLTGAGPAPAKKGSDVLYAWQQSARLAQSAREAGSGEVKLVVATDGEANRGVLDLRRQGYPDDDPATVVRRVVDDGNVPDLEGLDVELVGLGQKLPEAERTWLETFYLGLCEAGGGTCTVSSETIPTDAGGAGTDAPADPPLSVLQAVPGAPPGTVAVDPAAFVPDSTDLVDPAQVATALKPLRQELARGAAAGVDVVGHACDDGSPRGGLLSLSRERAETIKDLLVAGAPALEDVVTAIGIGADDPVEVPAGATDDERCAAQRTVVITPR